MVRSLLKNKSNMTSMMKFWKKVGKKTLMQDKKGDLKIIRMKIRSTLYLSFRIPILTLSVFSQSSFLMIEMFFHFNLLLWVRSTVRCNSTPSSKRRKKRRKNLLVKLRLALQNSRDSKKSRTEHHHPIDPRYDSLSDQNIFIF